VLNVSPKHHRPLSSKQVSLLLVIFKYKFVSSDLLAEVLGKDRSSVYENLYVLVKQEFIAKRYDKTYRLRGRPASYCLATGGIRYLRENTDTSEKALSNMYKNKNRDEEHIDKCLLVMRIANTLNRQVNNEFNTYTKYLLTDQKFFLRPLPDLYIRRRQKEENKQFHYTLDIFEPNLPTWVLRKRFRDYQEHCEDADLPEGDYPHVLLVAANNSTERRLLKHFAYSIQDFEFYVTTLERLLNPENIYKAVWKDETFDEEDEELELREL
jgi:predicted transcriptional regulator